MIGFSSYSFLRSVRERERKEGCPTGNVVPSSALSDTGWSGFGSWPGQTRAAASELIRTTPAPFQTPPARGKGTNVRGTSARLNIHWEAPKKHLCASDNLPHFLNGSKVLRNPGLRGNNCLHPHLQHHKENHAVSGSRGEGVTLHRPTKAGVTGGKSKS